VGTKSIHLNGLLRISVYSECFVAADIWRHRKGLGTGMTQMTASTRHQPTRMLPRPIKPRRNATSGRLPHPGPLRAMGFLQFHGEFS
jgi:hypothetical protein